MTTARLGVRLARRELRRRPWRTALVVLMVLIPTAAMATIVVVMRTSERTPEHEHAMQYGQADASAYLASGVEATDERVDGLLDRLPTGAEVLVERHAYDRFLADDARAYGELRDLRLDSPMVAGRFGDVDGRLADRDGEVVLTEDTARRLHVGIGDRVRSSLLGQRTLEVVGIVETADPGLGAGFVAVAPSGPTVAVTPWIDIPDGVQWSASSESNLSGWTTYQLFSAGRTSIEGRFWTYVGGGLGLIVLGTVITAAFAIGARRQLRTLGLLASSGASPRTVTWFLIAQGAVAGFTGSVLGAAVAVAGTHAIPDRWLTSMVDRTVDDPVVRAVDLVPVVVIGTAVAAAAAWIPARTAARVPTLQALAGRRPLPAVPARMPVIGAASVGVGCACFAMSVAGSDDGSGSSLWAVVAIAGGLALLGGVLASAPWLIALLERMAAHLPEAWRLAGRSLSRARVRSAAVVGAVATVAAAVVAGGALYASGDQGGDDVPYVRSDQVALSAYRYRASSTTPTEEDVAPPNDVIDDVLGIVGPADVIPVVHLELPTGDERAWSPWSVGLATEELLDHLGVPSDVRAAVDDGAALVLRPDVSSAPIPVETIRHVSDEMSNALPALLIADDVADRFGLQPAPWGADLLVHARDGISGAERDRLELLASDLQWSANEGDPSDWTMVVNVWLPDEEDLFTETMVKAVVLVVSLLLVLAVLAVGLAMAAKDSEDERQVLAAVGAPPRTLRKVGARRAALLALCAAVLAIPTGLLPAAAVVAAQPDDGNMSFRPDFVAVAFVAVVLPLAAGGGAALVGRLRDAVRPARPDSFAFVD